MKPIDLLIATGNRGKAGEFRDMLAGQGWAFRSLADLPAVPAVEETGSTFAENACLKATAYARQFHSWALADDSGLAVDVLNGKPGVTSARWAEMHGAGKGDADNNSLLLKQLADVPDEERTARFICVLALADPEGRVVLTAEEAVEGVLLRAPRGVGGFGYDPLFYVPALGKTTAEMRPEEKHAISHRGKALRLLKQRIVEAKLI